MFLYFRPSNILNSYSFMFLFIHLYITQKHLIEKKIIQYHYTEWPDHGIPEYTLPVLSFVKRATNSNPINGGPIVVHCR